MELDEQTKPAYWAVLPAVVRYDAALPAGAKLLFAEISALTEKKGFCFADNDYFVQLFEISERTLHPDSGRGRRRRPPEDLRRDQSSRKPRQK